MTARTLIQATVEWHLLAMPALAAILTCVGWIDRHVLSASIFCFTRKLLGESSPCRIRDAFGEAMIVHHPIDVQIFHADDAELIDDFTRLLVRKVMPLESNALMHARHNLAPLGSCGRVLLLLAEKTLCLSERVLFRAKETRIIYTVASRKVSEGFKSHIYSDLFKRFRQGLRVFNLTGEGSVPLARRLTPNVASLNLPFNQAMQFDVDIAEFREGQMMPVNLKACLREGETIVAMLSPKTRIARLFSRFHAAKESLKRKVEARGDVLQNLTVNCLQRFPLLLQRAEAVDLRVERKRFTAFFVGVFTLFEQFVVQPTTFIQRVPQDGSLPLCREDSEGERFNFVHLREISASLNVGRLATAI